MTQPYHAHIYFSTPERPTAVALRERLQALGAETPCFVGELRDYKVGPHPVPQFEIHFDASRLSALEPVLAASGLRVLIHPLTHDDFADHTGLARWIGEPVDLDLSVLDPPGVNQGFERFGRTDF